MPGLPGTEDCATFAVSLGRDAQGFWAGLSYPERTRLRARGRVRVGGDELTYDKATGQVEVVAVGPTPDATTASTMLAAWPDQQSIRGRKSA